MGLFCFYYQPNYMEHRRLQRFCCNMASRLFYFIKTYYQLGGTHLFGFINDLNK